MLEFLTFRKMITPMIIQVVFWILLAIVIVAGIGSIIGGIASSNGGQLVLTGLATLVLGPFLVRIYCELLILFFRIYDTLTEIRDELKRGA